MNSILAVLSQNILPIAIVATFGFAIRRWLRLDTRTLSTLVLKLLSPCLVFSSLVNSQLAGSELTGLSAFTVITIAMNGLVGLLSARLLRLSRQDSIALLIVLMFVNGGNFGMTLNRLRYGEPGLARAIIYFTTSTLIVYTFGLFLASMGRLPWREGLRRLAKQPAVYAAVLAVIFYRFDLSLPVPLMRGIEIAGEGAIPVLLVVLGMQMADLRGVPTLKLALPAIGLRLLVGPLLGVAAATLLGLTALTRSTAIIEASMPPAVFTIILSTEFELQPPVVTGIVVLATLLSPLTIAMTITLLGL